jgi:hypothetical protein
MALAAVCVVALAGCQPTVDEAKADFCKDLGEFAVAVQALRQIDETSPKQELDDAVDVARKALDELRGSAETLAEVQTDEIESAVNDLQSYSDSIPGDDTVGEAAADVKAATADTMAYALDIATTVCTYP